MKFFFCIFVFAAGLNAAASGPEMPENDLFAASTPGLEILSPFNAASRYADAYRECAMRLRNLPAGTQDLNVIYCYKNMIYALTALGRGEEIPALQKLFFTKYRDCLPFLAVLPFQKFENAGYFEDGKWIPGEHPDQKRLFHCTARQRVKLLRLLLDPANMEKAKKASPEIRFFYFRGVAEILIRTGAPYLLENGTRLDYLPEVEWHEKWIPDEYRFRIPAAPPDREFLNEAFRQMESAVREQKNPDFSKKAAALLAEQKSNADPDAVLTVSYTEKIKQRIENYRKERQKTDIRQSFPDHMSLLLDYDLDFRGRTCIGGGWGYAYSPAEYPDLELTALILLAHPDAWNSETEKYLSRYLKKRYSDCLRYRSQWTDLDLLLFSVSHYADRGVWMTLEEQKNRLSLFGLSMLAYRTGKPEQKVYDALSFDPETKALFVKDVRTTAALLRYLQKHEPASLLIPYLEKYLENKEDPFAKTVLNEITLRRLRPLYRKPVMKSPPQAEMNVASRLSKDGRVIHFTLDVPYICHNAVREFRVPHPLEKRENRFLLLNGYAVHYQQTPRGFSLFFRDLPAGKYTFSLLLRK